MSNKFEVTLHCAKGERKSVHELAGDVAPEEAIRLARLDLPKTAGDVRRVEVCRLPEEKAAPKVAKKAPAKK